MNASIPPGVCTKWAIHPYAVLGNVMDPVVCNSCTLLFSLHHLDDSAIGLKVNMHTSLNIIWGEFLSE